MRREPTANRRGSTVELPSHSGAAIPQWSCHPTVELPMDYRMLHNMGSESASSGRVRPILTELWSFQIIWLGSADRTGRTMNRQKDWATRSGGLIVSQVGAE